MQTYTVNTKSWHYRIRTIYGSGGNRFSGDVDFCNYVTDFLWGCFLIAFMAGLGGVLAGGTADMLLWLYFSWVSGTWLQPNEIFLGGIVVVSLVAAFGFVALCVYVKDTLRAKRHSAEYQPSFLTMVYRKFKDKVCYKIAFKEE